jgi:hypothetical protein
MSKWRTCFNRNVLWNTLTSPKLRRQESRPYLTSLIWLLMFPFVFQAIRHNDMNVKANILLLRRVFTSFVCFDILVDLRFFLSISRVFPQLRQKCICCAKKKFKAISNIVKTRSKTRVEVLVLVAWWQLLVT